MKLLNKYLNFQSSKAQKPTIKAGQRLNDRYKLVELVGSGAMGSVYRAEDHLLGEVTVAVKFLTQTFHNDAIASRFAREARIGALLGHKSLNIVRVLDYGLHADQVPFYVMEYMQGKTLEDFIEAGRMPIHRFLNLMTQVCAGLKCAHQGIHIEGELHRVIHRDIKPSNIFLIKDASLGELAKLLDFGIADFLSSQAQEMRSHSFVGTVAYGSPEQFAHTVVDARSDIYSLGITMFEVLTGSFPIWAEANTIDSWAQAHQQLSPQRLKDVDPTVSIPRELEDLVMSCIAKSPDQRPQTVTDIIKSLKKIAQHSADASLPVAHPIAIDTSSISPKQHAQRANLTIAEQTQVVFWSIEDLAWRAPWPSNKPIANIVFAQTMRSSDQEAVGLWVMLTKQEIEKRSLSNRHTHFLGTFTPHPAILWITTLFDRQHGPRWLPNYIDLKDPGGQHIIQLLSELRYYLLMLYDASNPSQPVHVVTVKIPERQCHLLQNCLTKGKEITPTGSLVASKQLLKQKYQAVKQNVLDKL